MESIYGSKGVVLPKKLIIPEINDERLLALYGFLKPIVTIDNVKYTLREFTEHELRHITYTWNRAEDKRDIVDTNSLEIVEDFLCLHKYGYYGLFKPSIAEVLSQTPIDSIRYANLFEIVEQPETREDVFRYKSVVDNGFHLSKVRTYKVN